MQAPHEKKCREVACTPARETLAIKGKLFLTNRNPYPHHHGKRKTLTRRINPPAQALNLIRGIIRVHGDLSGWAEKRAASKVMCAPQTRTTLTDSSPRVRKSTAGGPRSFSGATRLTEAFVPFEAGCVPCPTGRDGDREVMAMLCTKLRCGSFPRPQSLRGPS
jgi:hypothetical protein